MPNKNKIEQSWEEKLHSLWQTTRENQGKYEKIKSFISEQIEKARQEEREKAEKEITQILQSGIGTNQTLDVFIGKVRQEAIQQERKRILNLLQRDSKKEINNVVFLDTQIETLKTLIENEKKTI